MMTKTTMTEALTAALAAEVDTLPTGWRHTDGDPQEGVLCLYTWDRDHHDAADRGVCIGIWATAARQWSEDGREWTYTGEVTISYTSESDGDSYPADSWEAAVADYWERLPRRTYTVVDDDDPQGQSREEIRATSPREAAEEFVETGEWPESTGTWNITVMWRDDDGDDRSETIKVVR